MARPGQTVENPITGERFTFRTTSAGTNGELLEIDFILLPGRGRLLRHVHPHQTETWTVCSPGGRFWVAGREFDAHPGDVVTAHPGEPHQFWNTGTEELHLAVEFRPAGSQEEFFALLCQLGKEGRTNRKGLPSPLLGALVLRNHTANNRVTAIPAPLQRLGLPLLCRLGTLLGYENRAERLRQRALSEPG